MSALSEETRLALIDAELDEYPPSVREQYLNSIAKGASPFLAIGFATRSAPRMKGGDRIFTEGAERKMRGMDPENRKLIQAEAAKAGINTHGKYYVGGLGRYTDSHAWVTSAQDVLDICKKRNLNATGYVNHKATPPDKPPERKPLAEHLIRECTERILKNEPETAAKLKEGRLKPGELRERVIERHGRKRKPQ